MTPARLLASLLGITGLVITAFIAITDQTWLAVVFLGPLLSIPLILAIIGRPKRWFDPAMQAARLDARGNPIYRPFTWLDYLLLGLMLLASIPLDLLRSRIPAGLLPPLDATAIPMFAFLSMAVSAFEWQRRDYDFDSAMPWLFVTGLGALLLAGHNIRAGIYGFVLIYCGVWSLLRVGLRYSLGHLDRAAR